MGGRFRTVDQFGGAHMQPGLTTLMMAVYRETDNTVMIVHSDARRFVASLDD